MPYDLLLTFGGKDSWMVPLESLLPCIYTNLFKYFLHILGICLPITEAALQTTNAINIDTVFISSDVKKNFQITQSKNKNQLYTTQSIDKLISKTSGSFIRNYGRGSLSTLAVKGGTSQHTSITWNGCPIQNPMLGLSDLSLIPSFLFQNVELLSEGSSALLGNGALAGNLNFVNQTKSDSSNNLSVQLAQGSFGYSSHLFQNTRSYKNHQLRLSYSFEKADNDFDFFIGPDKRKQSNAEYSRQNAMLEYRIDQNRMSRTNLRVWYSNNTTNIPPLTTQSENLANQTDQSLKSQVEHSWKGPSTFHKIIATSIWDRQRYTDPLILLKSHNTYHSQYAEYTNQLVLESNLMVLSGLDFQSTTAQTLNYSNKEKQYLYSIFQSIKKPLKNQIIKLGYRLSHANQGAIRLSPDLFYQLQLQSNLNIALSLSENFRRPTLNDLFWNPGGNPNLKAETSRNYDLIFEWTPSVSKAHSFNLKLNPFVRRVNNWIIWVPQDFAFFAPSNLGEVRSEGLIIQSRFYWNFKDSNISIGTTQQVVKSYSTEDVPSQSLLRGDQLFYTPKHKSIIDFAWTYKNQTLQLHHQYISTRKGFNQTVEPFTIIDLLYSLKTKSSANSEFEISFEVQNICNTHYRIIERRPMPGRNFTLTIQHILK